MLAGHNPQGREEGEAGDGDPAAGRGQDPPGSPERGAGPESPMRWQQPDLPSPQPRRTPFQVMETLLTECEWWMPMASGEVAVGWEPLGGRAGQGLLGGSTSAGQVPASSGRAHRLRGPHPRHRKGLRWKNNDPRVTQADFFQGMRPRFGEPPEARQLSPTAFPGQPALVGAPGPSLLGNFRLSPTSDENTQRQTRFRHPFLLSSGPSNAGGWDVGRMRVVWGKVLPAGAGGGERMQCHHKLPNFPQTSVSPEALVLVCFAFV